MRTADPANWLFSKDKPNVIAYGERIFTEATAGDGMIEFEIPIEYYKTDIKPSNIIVVASANRYGDYYTGGQSSTMWLDDLQLVLLMKRHILATAALGAVHDYRCKEHRELSTTAGSSA